MEQAAFRFATSIGPGGKVAFELPIPEGTNVEVVVRTQTNESFDDLANAASSSLNFWDNAWDDEDWNHA